MVSIKNQILFNTLPEKYINGAHELIECICKKYTVDCAFFFIEHDENQSWIDGDWVLNITTNDSKLIKYRYEIIMDYLKTLNSDLYSDIEFIWYVNAPNVEYDNDYYKLKERIYIKKQEE